MLAAGENFYNDYVNCTSKQEDYDHHQRKLLDHEDFMNTNQLLSPTWNMGGMREIKNLSNKKKTVSLLVLEYFKRVQADTREKIPAAGENY